MMIDPSDNAFLAQAQAAMGMGGAMDPGARLQGMAQGALDKTTGDKGNDKLRESAESFEAQFLSQMMKPVFNTVQTDKLFGGGKGEEMFKSLMVDEYGKMTARAGGVGVADAVMRQLLSEQEAK